MANFKKMHAKDGGWCDWVFPIMSGYKIACCDCGLVHDMEFVVAKVSRTTKAGTFTAQDITDKLMRVKFRARRNNRSTAAVRRHKK